VIFLKILYITNLFPYLENDSRGNFITNRLKVLRKSNIDFSAFGTISQDNLFVKTFRKIIGSTRREKYENYYEIDGIRYNYLSFDRRLYDIFSEYVLKKDYTLEYAEELANKKYKSFVQKKYNLIHAHGMYDPPAGLVAKLLSEKLNIPYVVTCHGSDINLLMEKATGLYIDVLENAAKVIFVSNALLNKAKFYGYSGSNSVVIPNGIEPNLSKPLDREKIKRELGLNKKVVGFVGGLKPIKRADKFSEIFENISSTQEVEFLVVGDGELREKIEKKCEQKNLNVKFVGRVPNDEAPYYMNAMDVMILPSRNEGFGSVIIESQACGVPVVGSSNGGIPEAIGDGGIVVEEGENFEKRFADAVVELLENPIEREYLRERALGFSWKSIVKQEVAVYEEALKEVRLK
jgi:glycosyltransferase involved in cell wall biosynthesis